VARLDTEDSFRYQYVYHDLLPSQDRREMVVLHCVIPHELNRGYRGMWGIFVERANGVLITQMTDLVRALEHPVNGFHVIEVSNHGLPVNADLYHSNYGRHIVLDAHLAAVATREVMEQLGIQCDRSVDLR
jgi:hypothetical protein